MSNITTVGDAIVEFNRSVTYTYAEAGNKVLQDYKRFTDAVTSAQFRLAEEFGVIAFNDQLKLMRTAYTESLVDSIHYWDR